MIFDFRKNLRNLILGGFLLWNLENHQIARAEHISNVNRRCTELAEKLGVEFRVSSVYEPFSIVEVDALRAFKNKGIPLLGLLVNEYPHLPVRVRAAQLLSEIGTDDAADIVLKAYDKTSDIFEQESYLTSLLFSENMKARKAIIALLTEAKIKGTWDLYGQIIILGFESFNAVEFKSILLKDLNDGNQETSQQAYFISCFVKIDDDFISPFITGLNLEYLPEKIKFQIGAKLLSQTIHDFGKSQGLGFFQLESSSLSNYYYPLVEVDQKKWLEWWSREKPSFSIARQLSTALSRQDRLKYVALARLGHSPELTSNELMSYLEEVIFNNTECEAAHRWVVMALFKRNNVDVMPLLVRAASYGYPEVTSVFSLRQLKRLTGIWLGPVSEEKLESYFTSHGATKEEYEGRGDITKLISQSWKSWLDENKEKLVWDEKLGRFNRSGR